MWYQVVSPPNMPRSRLSWEGKVHSATVKEATPRAISKATRLHLRRGDFVALAGRHAPAEPGRAEPDADADDDDPAESSMLSVPSSSSERTSRATAIVASASRASAPENSGTIQRRSQ